MNGLIDTLEGKVKAAFKAEGLDEDLGTVRRADRPDLADYQCNGALAAAKAAKTNPRALAERLVSHLPVDEVIAGVEIAGPGFINLKLTAAALATRAQEIAQDHRAGAETVEPRKVIIDFGGPNIAKPMHVGHLRSSIIGDSLQRLFRFLGDEVTSDIHMGDWGLPMGMLITELRREQPDLPYFNPQYDGDYPSHSPVTLEDLERMYPAAAAACKADEERATEARQLTADLQSGHPGYRALWQHFLAVTRQALDREFSDLGVSFSIWMGESDVDPLIGPMIQDLKDFGIVIEDQGAQVIPVAEPGEEPGLPPLILQKRDGGVLYGTTDLATIIDRARRFRPDLILYVVDQRQADHFKQVFRAAEKANIMAQSALEHIGFGTMNGTDGKPFKTRAGGVMKLHDLISQAKDKARERLHEGGLGAELSQDEFEDVAHKVAIAAIKFADLQNWRASNYIFDLDRFMTFEGKTGPYLLYQAVRAKALLRKANTTLEDAAKAAIAITEPAERDLVMLLDGFSDVLHGAYDKRAPHVLAEHVYGLAQAFSKFYAACPILQDPEKTPSRLALVAATLRQLTVGLDLLGLDIPDRM